MSQYKSEYSGAAVSGKPCGYSSLGCYYGQSASMAPPGPTSNSYIIPNYSPIGYNALTKDGVGNKKSYYNVNDAYGSCSATSYSTRLCGGCNIGGK